MITTNDKIRLRQKMQAAMGNYWSAFNIPFGTGLFDIVIILCGTLKKCLAQLESLGYVYSPQYGILTKDQLHLMEKKARKYTFLGYSTVGEGEPVFTPPETENPWYTSTMPAPFSPSVLEEDDPN